MDNIPETGTVYDIFRVPTPLSSSESSSEEEEVVDSPEIESSESSIPFKRNQSYPLGLLTDTSSESSWLSPTTVTQTQIVSSTRSKIVRKISKMSRRSSRPNKGLQSQIHFSQMDFDNRASSGPVEDDDNEEQIYHDGDHNSQYTPV
jgi:hypothetical protein